MDKKGKEVNIPCVCLDDKMRPNEIPVSKWVKKNAAYTIIEFAVLNMQNRKIGVRLAEIDLSDCFPYTFFAVERFGIVDERLVKEANEAVQDLLEEVLTFK